MSQIVNLEYKDIPEKYEHFISSISNKVFIKIYSQFKYFYFDFSIMKFEDQKTNQTSIEDCLFYFTNENRFITYQIYTKESKVNSIFCAEKKCFILESMDINVLIPIINKIKSSKINCDIKNFDLIKSSIDIEVNNDINTFIKHFQSYIQTNAFVKYTIRAIISYLIRRYYYPSIYFQDQSFFTFDQKIDKFERNIKVQLTNLFRSYSMEEVKKIQNNLNIEINKNMDHSSESKNRYQEFDKSDFVFLKELYVNIFLCIHLPSLYLFALKKVTTISSHEETFYHNYHRCILRCYGFIKYGQGLFLIYEFMCNDSLSKYISENQKEINPLFTFTTIIRLYEGLYFLHTNNLIHRDLKAENILIDHDYNTYISDFETVRKIIDKNDYLQNNDVYTYDFGNNYSSYEQINGMYINFQTDIYGFGLIFYFILTNELRTFKTISEYDFKNIPASIKDIILKCMDINQDKRAQLPEIYEMIYHETNLNSYIEEYILKKHIIQIKIIDIINYFFEVILFRGYSFSNHI